MDENIEKIVGGLKEYFKKAGFKQAVLGLSGGVDSALVAKLAVMALGKDNVTAVMMPSEGISSDHSLIDAENWAHTLGIRYYIIPIKEFLEPFENNTHWQPSAHARMNVQSRLRATILYHYANTHHSLVLGTGNKTELSLGYFTKHGDGAVDVLPIGSLYKTQVWEISRELKLPEEIIQKVPSAELKPGHTDEAEIGMSYAEMDEILQKFEAGNMAQTENERRLQARIDANRHKRGLPPVI